MWVLPTCHVEPTSIWMSASNSLCLKKLILEFYSEEESTTIRSLNYITIGFSSRKDWVVERFHSTPHLFFAQAHGLI